MKKFKVIIISILVLSIVTMGAVFQIKAVGNPAFSFNNISGNAGDEVKLTLNCSNNPGITGWAVNIGYDSDVLQLITADCTSAFGDVTVSKNINENPFRAQWFGLNNSTANGVMLALTFRINKNAQSGDYVVSVSYYEDEVVNVNDENVYFDTTNGVVTVRNSEPIPTEPIPTEPIPTEPVSTEPIPTELVPIETVPTEPKQSESQSVVEPTFADLCPAESASPTAFSTTPDQKSTNVSSSSLASTSNSAVKTGATQIAFGCFAVLVTAAGVIAVLRIFASNNKNVFRRRKDK